MSESASRDTVLEETCKWIGTGFHMNAATRGAGIDCGRLPWLVYRACGIDVPDLPPHWPRDFMCHKMAGPEPYIELIQQKLVEVEIPEPGDLAVFKPARSQCYSHAAIVVDWPKVIHARGVGTNPQVEYGAAGEWPLDGATVRFFTPFFHVTR